MSKNIYETLQPLYDVVNAIDNIILENNRLKEENTYLKERLDWYENNLKENAKVAGSAVGDFIKACLDGRITTEGDTTIIKSSIYVPGFRMVLLYKRL